MKFIKFLDLSIATAHFEMTDFFNVISNPDRVRNLKVILLLSKQYANS